MRNGISNSTDPSGRRGRYWDGPLAGSPRVSTTPIGEEGHPPSSPTMIFGKFSLALLVVLCLLLGWSFYNEISLFEEEPPEKNVETDWNLGVKQTNFSGEAQSLPLGEGFAATKKARVRLLVSVLSTKAYSGVPSGEISPVDIVVSWDSRFVDSTAVVQSNRWYFVPSGLLQTTDIDARTANIHLVGNMKPLPKISKGDIICIDGWLVDIAGPNGFLWKTSQTRTDKGDGACEIVLVSKAIVVNGSPVTGETRDGEFICLYQPPAP